METIFSKFLSLETGFLKSLSLWELYFQKSYSYERTIFKCPIHVNMMFSEVLSLVNKVCKGLSHESLNVCHDSL